MNYVRTLFFAVVCIPLVSCSDPYAKPIPPEGLADGEASRLASRLEPGDRELFQRWTDRMKNGTRIDQDSSATTVRAAILVERNFEEQQKIALAETRRRADAEKEKQAQIEKQRQAAAIAFDEINKSVSVSVGGYSRAPIFSNNYEVIGYQWQFDLKIKNLTDSTIAALSGTLLLSDAFDNNNERFSGQVDITVKPRSTVTKTVSFPANDASKLHNLMRNGSQISARFVPTSIAFSDGRTIVANPPH